MIAPTRDMLWRIENVFEQVDLIVHFSFKDTIQK